MNTQDDLSVEWAELEGEGLERVVKTDSFKSGFVRTGEVGKTAEGLGYFPDVKLSSDKVIIAIPYDDDGLAHQLAQAIDGILGDATAA